MGSPLAPLSIKLKNGTLQHTTGEVPAYYLYENDILLPNQTTYIERLVNKFYQVLSALNFTLGMGRQKSFRF